MKSERRTLRQQRIMAMGALSISVALALGMAPFAAGAQDAAVQLSIAAQPLGQALLQLGRQTALQIFYPQELVNGLTAPAVTGTVTPEQALQRLLQGTGITYVRQGNSVTLSRALSTVQLAPVRVHAGAADLPPAYAGGQVATGSRVGLLGNKSLMETPFSTISYTDRYIADRQVQELSQVIASTDPSVFNNGATGMIGDSFSLRGFNVSNSDVALNGLYGMVPYYRISPEFIERVEVLKGPAAMLNGMPPGGSVGGSINLVPKRAGAEPLARLTATYASDTQFGTHVDLGRRFGENQQFGIRFNGVYRNGDSAVRHQEKQAVQAALGLDWRTERVRVSADLYTNKDHTRGLNRGVSLAPGLSVPAPPDADTLLAPDWTFSTTKDNAVIVRGEFDITQHITAYAGYGHGKTDFDSLASATYQVFNDKGDYRNNFAHQRSVFKKDTADAGVRFAFQTGPIGHDLAVSASWYQHDNYFGFLRNMMPKDWVTNLYDPQWGASVDTSFSGASLPKTGALRTMSYGIADTLSFLDDRVLLTIGLRRQKVTSDTFDAATGARAARYDAAANTPTVALLVKATDRLSIYGNYIEGLSQGATAPAAAANAGEIFPPFRTKQHEVGVKFDMGSLTTTLSAFQIRRPSSYTDPATNVFSFGGEQRNRGLELSAFGEAMPGLRLMGGIAYTEAKLTKTAGGVNQGKYVTAMPKWQGKLGLEWDVPGVPDLTLTGNVVAVSKQYINADNSLSVPGRTIVNLGARYTAEVVGRPVVLRASVLNVTNKAYWAGSLTSGLGAPRTFMLSASVDF